VSPDWQANLAAELRRRAVLVDGDQASQIESLATHIDTETHPGELARWLVETAEAGHNRELIFSADDGKHGYELWRSDGTRNGTKLVRDIVPGKNDSYPNQLTTAGGMVFFSALDSHGYELWRTDGTRKGTKMLRDIDRSFSGPAELTDVAGTLFFRENDAKHGDELWRSNGTSRGTKLVRDIRHGRKGSYPYDLTAAAGKLFFSASDTGNGSELWKAVP
jgi:ELWxxDGT repeat protein